ncbi:solute carrier family 41 member 1-like [Chrysoperla carnea]|uniref:solute carrier family 41 member 1-like n=1 Tax=Chrysoperla carnea TaxID=189513 RepID=UPI001D0763B4|nr:solute carrier family 41 member 1-like [Chrysoperla carnea]XP_044741603.1 solute carrier family 41 member 1-like [Chrysoperla carnea]XP_044741605.1 solute carrier family 41 member 1-like [Chrysoperla carnea]
MVAFTESSKDSIPPQRPAISIISLPFDQANQTEVAKTPAAESYCSAASFVSIATTSNESTEALDGKCINKSETWYSTLMQVAIPFFLAGIGTIGAGLVLERVQAWPVFQEVSGILILVPALLGLKGNLDMCLASRMCTQANLGNAESKREICKMITGNVALVQVQAIVAAVLVAVFSVTVGSITNNQFKMEHGALLMASAVFTATTCCFILDFLLIAVVFLAYRLNCNPDNLATPLAASIGDIVSVTCLSFISNILYRNLETHYWVVYLVMGIYVLLLPMWILIVRRNKYTKKILMTGWTPVLSALFISGFGGLVLEYAEQYKGFVVFQPIINGIGGNLVSVQASRLATMFHQTSILGIIPPHTKTWVSPCKALFTGVPSAYTARILIAMSIPGQLVFLFSSDYISQGGVSTVTPIFALAYICAASIQIMFLLYTAHVLIHILWRRKIDPDNSAIPYLTALGDLSGSSLLLVSFLILNCFGQEYGSNVDN